MRVAGPQPGAPQPDGPQPDGGDGWDVWPVGVWIVAGAVGFVAAPWSYATWKGILYFMVGTPPMLLVAGAATRRFHRTVAAMVDEVFPGPGWAGGFAALVIRLMLRAVETVLVLSLARAALAALQAGPA